MYINNCKLSNEFYAKTCVKTLKGKDHKSGPKILSEINSWIAAWNLYHLKELYSLIIRL